MTPMDLAGLHDVLLDAFPKRGDLEQLLELRMNVPFNHVVPEGRTHPEAVFDIIKYLQSRSRLGDLIAAAREANPSNQGLTAFAESLPRQSTAVTVRRFAFRNPVSTLMVFAIGGLAGAGLSLMVASGRLTPSQLTVGKIALALIVAVLTAASITYFRLPVGNIGWLAPAAVFAVSIGLPASSGVVTGRILYVETSVPVSGVVVRIPGTTNASKPTDSSGEFFLTNVPASQRELEAQIGGNPAARLTVVERQGGEYAVIPKPRVETATTRIAIPSSAWRTANSPACAAPKVTFTLDYHLPPHDSGVPVRVQLDVAGGVTIVGAFKRNHEGYAIDPDLSASFQRRWEFPHSPGGTAMRLEICLQPGPAQPASTDVLRTQYWYVLTQ